MRFNADIFHKTLASHCVHPVCNSKRQMRKTLNNQYCNKVTKQFYLNEHDNVLGNFENDFTLLYKCFAISPSLLSDDKLQFILHRQHTSTSCKFCLSVLMMFAWSGPIMHPFTLFINESVDSKKQQQKIAMDLVQLKAKVERIQKQRQRAK